MALQSWLPKEEGARELCTLLHEYLTPGMDQIRIIQKLQHWKQVPDFDNYLTWILCKAEGQPVEVRQSAGLLLKNNLKAIYETLAIGSKTYIKLELAQCIGLSDRQLRATVGTVISMIVEKGTLKDWPELLQILIQCIDSNDYNHMEGALDAIFKICEDQPLQLDEDVPGLFERPINLFFPRLLQLFSSQHTNLRRLALASVNQFICYLPAIFYTNMDKYLSGIFALSSDHSGEVRKLVCSGVILILEVEPDFLIPHMKNVVNFMLRAIQDSDQDVALEACEFWTVYCEAELTPNYIREILPQLVSVLLSKMVYSDDDDAVLEAEEGNDVPDREQDMKPRFHSSKAHKADGGDDKEEDDDEDVINVWTLRKCSAASIDILSNMFGDEMLPILMPLVQAHLQDRSDNTWKEREASILAMGAIAEGCIHSLLPLIPQMITTLLPHLEDPRPLVRSITCWTISRYCKWITKPDKPEGQALFDQVLSGFLRCILDPNKRVQEASCSALATLQEEAGDEISTRIEPILQHLMFVFQKYDKKNLRIVYDNIGILAESIGNQLAKPQYLQMLMPPLLEKWNQLQDMDRDMFPLFEVFTSIAQALGKDFSPYAEPLFFRTNNIIKNQLLSKINPSQATFPYDKEIITCSLDLLSGIIDALGQQSESLISRSDIREIIIQCATDEANDVKQSAFALIGDVAKASVDHLKPRLNDLLNLCISQLEISNLVQEKYSVVNNACWALGELAIKLKEEVSPVVLPALNSFLHILNSGEILNKSLVENCVITLGRLCVATPQLLSPHLKHFFNSWCSCLAAIRDDIEKEDAFHGLCAIVLLNPHESVNFLVPMVNAIASWHDIHSPELRNELTQILQGFKHMLVNAQEWDKFTSSIDASVLSKLSSKYNI